MISGAYFYGRTVGITKCEIQNLNKQTKAIEQNQTKQRIINDTVYKTGVDDIRHILLTKYTIAE